MDWTRGLKLIYWWKPGCHTCDEMTPIISKFSNDRRVPVMSINLDDHDPLAEQYEVNMVPTVMLLKNGIEVNRSNPTSRADLDRLLVLG